MRAERAEDLKGGRRARLLEAKRRLRTEGAATFILRTYALRKRTVVNWLGVGPWLLFSPECHHRIHPAGPSGREERRQPAAGQEKQRCGPQNERVPNKTSGGPRRGPRLP